MKAYALSRSREQPKGLLLLAFTQMWESFSYYGMRVLLVLYLINELKYTDGDAFALYALYTALVEFGAFAGGYCADRFLGLRRAVLLGGWLICLGHLCLAFSHITEIFFLGLGCIVCGATLFRSNLKALVGNLYNNTDKNRESGFTLFYTSINVGGFAAALLCGYAAQEFGWHIGFGIAAIGMALGMIVFTCSAGATEDHDISHKTTKVQLTSAIVLSLVACGIIALLLIGFQDSLPLMPPLAFAIFSALLYKLSREMTRKRVLTMLGLLALLIVYFTFEEWMGSLLMVYTERFVDRVFAGVEIPSAMLSSINPLTIIIVGPLLSIVMRKHLHSLGLRISIAFCCLATAFTLLFLAGTALGIVVVSFSAIALGELFIAPSVYAYCSEAAPPHHKGLMMGLVTMAFAMANLLSGQLGQIASSWGDNIFPGLFLVVAILSAMICIVIPKGREKKIYV